MTRDKVDVWMANMDDWHFQESFAFIVELYGVMFAEMKRRDLFANPVDPRTINDKQTEICTHLNITNTTGNIA